MRKEKEIERDVIGNRPRSRSHTSEVEIMVAQLAKILMEQVKEQKPKKTKKSSRGGEIAQRKLQDNAP